MPSGTFEPERVWTPFQRRTIILKFAENARTDPSQPLDLDAATQRFKDLENDEPLKLKALVAKLSPAPKE